ncbi:high mobility group protein B3 [Trichonephila clavata]|uniref:High mobility group protein B3 n=1 Tax=Trichonephila clavata TaxID=2740835 RepID=A0A8X6LTV3_TRICU|nr:high mobility group protein B3 [Trichonephila clavata]
MAYYQSGYQNQSMRDGRPYHHQNVSLSAEYNYQQSMAQHAVAINAANSSSLHSAMAQMPTLQAMNSDNQSYSTSSLGNSNAAYYHSYGSLGSSGSGYDNSVFDHRFVGHGHQRPGEGESKELELLEVQKESRSWNNNRLPLCHQNMHLSTEYNYQQTITQQPPAAANTANNSSSHFAMAQMPTFPASLNMSMNSVNQGYSASCLDSCLGHSNAAYHYPYRSVGSPRTGNGNRHHGRHHYSRYVWHRHTDGRKSKENKSNKNGIPPLKQATTTNIHCKQYRDECKSRMANFDQHDTGYADRINKLKSDEEIEKWRVESHFPTAANISKRKAEETEKEARGEVIEEKEFGIFKMQKQDQNGANNRHKEQHWKGKKLSRFCKRNDGPRMSSNVPSVSTDLESDDDSHIKLHRFLGIFASADVAVDIPVNDKSEEVSTDAVKNVNHNEMVQEALNSNKTYVQCKTEEKDEKTCKNFSKIEQNKTLNRHKNADHNSFRKETLLEKLLADETRKERNVIMQCVRHIVKNDFFDISKRR